MFFALFIGLRVIQGIQHRLAVLAELGGAHAFDSGEGFEGGGIFAGDLAKDAVVADDVGGQGLLARQARAQGAEALEADRGFLVELADVFDDRADGATARAAIRIFAGINYK